MAPKDNFDPYPYWLIQLITWLGRRTLPDPNPPGWGNGAKKVLEGIKDHWPPEPLPPDFESPEWVKQRKAASLSDSSGVVPNAGGAVENVVNKVWPWE